MWSYYGDNHYGICVAFKINWKKIFSSLLTQFPNETIIEISEILKNNGIRFDYRDNQGNIVRFGLQYVQYSQNVPVYPVDKFMKAYFDDACENELSWLITGTKHIGWSHEKEWRLVCFNRYSEKTDDLLPLDVFDFIKPCGIILGIGMAQSVKSVIKKYYGCQYSIVELKYAIDEKRLTMDYSVSPSKDQIINLQSYPKSSRSMKKQDCMINV